MAAAIAESWETLKDAISAYTGLSPATFFTAVAVAVAVYYAISSFFAAPPPTRYQERDFVDSEPLPPPVQLGEITDEELKKYDGSDPKKPLLMAIKGQIYDVSQSRIFYGPGGPYALFAGKDASRALAKMSFEEQDLTGDISGLGPFELDALQDWEYKFMGKYTKVGAIKKPVITADAESSGNAAEATVSSSENGPSEPREVASSEKPREVASSENGPSEPREVASSENGPSEPREVASSENGPSEPREVDEQVDATIVPKETNTSDDHIAVPKEPENLGYKAEVHKD